MQRVIVDEIFAAFALQNKEPKTELEYTNHFTLLVAIILSAQSTDVAVNKTTRVLFTFADTPEKMLTLGENKLKDVIKNIGLYNNKASNIIALTNILINQYSSVVPNGFEELIRLPGVGRKTANVFLNCAFGHHTIAVDTHVARIARRIGFTVNSNPKMIELDLLELIPKKWHKFAHNWLVLHGRYVCKARLPNCTMCLIAEYCEYYKARKNV